MISDNNFWGIIQEGLKNSPNSSKNYLVTNT